MQVQASAPQLVSHMSPFDSQLAAFPILQYVFRWYCGADESVDNVSRGKERILQPSTQIDASWQG